MTELASKSQLRMAFVRRALVCVPLILVLGSLSGSLAGSGANDPWYVALEKPWYQPPGWAFPVAWTILFTLMGLALAVVLSARGAAGRGLAIGLFVVQFAINLSWSPVFFAAHQVTTAYWIIVAMIVAAVAATFAMGRVRPLAAWLMVPYLCWISFAAILNHEIDLLNPDAETLVPRESKAQIPL